MTSNSFADRAIRASQALESPIVAGIDPRPDLLSPELERAGTRSPRALARAYVTFAEGVLEGLRDLVPAVKVQIAFYEQLGLPGMWAYARTLRLAREAGFLVIADIKRGDVGSTAEAYAAGHFGDAARSAGADADAVTLNPYLGKDGIEPFLRACRDDGRGAFALVRTSNPSARELQDLVVGADGRPVYEHVADLVAEWGRDLIGESGYSSLGAVVGATYPAELATIRERNPSLLLLVPGYGAQGGKAEDVAGALDERGAGLLVASSRGILKGYRKAAEEGRPAADGIRDAASQMRDEIRTAWQARRRDATP